MNRFDPSNLSPLPKAPVPCELPYGLTWGDLEPILPGFHEQKNTKPQAFSSFEKQGLHGGTNSCILTARYPTGEDKPGSKTIFIKRTTDPDKAEAQKYQVLASRGIPTPSLLAAIPKEGAEILLLEFLPTIGINFRSASEVNSMLHLAAQLNSIQEHPLLFEWKPRKLTSHAAFDETVHAALTELSRDPRLSGMIDVRRWFNVYKITQEAYRAMPRAINHSEFYFQQVGWAERESVRQLVLFDLETMSLLPRFTDIAGVLYPLARYTGRDQVEMFRVYLDRLQQLNRLEFRINEALRELRLVRVTTLCYSLPWLVRRAENPDALYDGPLMTVSCIREDFSALKLL